MNLDKEDNEDKEILFAEKEGSHSSIGIITLNRPTVLNALTHRMVKALFNQLQIWSQAKHIKAVVIRSAEGKAFCAGGDLRFIYEQNRSNRSKEIDLFDFFRDEYRLNELIFHYPKPYIAIMSGITMGGGAGISIHGSHRVATERLIFAMPETGIGFFPDVGGSYFLPRLPAYSGYYLGLSGARVNSTDCLQLGIVQHQIAHQAQEALVSALVQKEFAEHENGNFAVTNVINQFEQTVWFKDSLFTSFPFKACFAKDKVETILSALQQTTHPSTTEIFDSLLRKSPTSLKVTLKALQNGKDLSFDACMQQESHLTRHFLANHDFFEGIRALLIDKDKNPQWQPLHFADVSEETIENYFTP